MTITSRLLIEQLSGRVIVSNERGDRSEGKNLVVYTGGDIIAALLSGKANYKISHFYFEYENVDGSVTAAAVARGDTVSSRQAVSDPYDLLRAPLVAVPLITASDENHEGNQATFHAVTSGTTGLINELTFSAGAFSQVYAVCLVAAPVSEDSGQDVLYARYLLETPVPVTGTGLVSGSWATIAD